MTAAPAAADRALVEVVLPGVPGLGGLYVRGVAASVRLAAAGRAGRAPRTLPDVAYLAAGIRADADHLTAYQHLLGESASDVLPAGFVHVLAFPVATALMVRPDFPLPLVGMVHLANHVTQLRPVSLGDALDVRAFAQDLAPHRLGTQVELVTEVRVAGADHDVSAGPVAWRGVSTYLAKGVRLGPERVADDAADERTPFVPPVPTGQWRLAADTGRRYAAISGDRNPIHLSALTAKALGFPRAIAHGMYTASRALAVVGAARGDTFTWAVEFAKPVLLPGTVTVRIAPDETGAYDLAGWNAQSRKPHVTGRVTPLV
ncbi:MAG TPA: MaoC/PaaZ C-terminal domain-containing protein [Cellulomonas sp.]